MRPRPTSITDRSGLEQRARRDRRILPGLSASRALLLLVAVSVPTGCAQSLEPAARSLALTNAPRAGDRDRDGLLDTEEAELAARFAPIVVLHREDEHRPASVPWLLSRSDPFANLRRDSQSAERLSRRAVHPSEAELRRVRSGSQAPEEWTTYVHVYERDDRGVSVQYWFFYPYNDGPLFFDHEYDWEHVTVRLNAHREPERIDLARHENDHPGVSYAWSTARREGEHPVVFSARGSHASYQRHTEAVRFDSVAACDSLERCPHPIWRTWQAGGLQNLGEPGRPLCLEQALSFPGRWGTSGLVPGTSAPYGPLHHRGYCVNGLRGCAEERPTTVGRL